MDAYLDFIKASIDLEAKRAEAEENWRKDCNARGEQIYYDMSDATERAVACDCAEPCGEDHVIKVGRYKTRPCPNHYEGHLCNPGNAMIKNVSVSSASEL